RTHAEPHHLRVPAPHGRSLWGQAASRLAADPALLGLEDVLLDALAGEPTFGKVVVLDRARVGRVEHEGTDALGIGRGEQRSHPTALRGPHDCRFPGAGRLHDGPSLVDALFAYLVSGTSMIDPPPIRIAAPNKPDGLRISRSRRDRGP